MFVCSSSVSESIEKYRRIITDLDEIKLIPRAGITCCFLNGRGFKSVHEVGVSLLYIYILLTTQSVPLKNTAITIIISFLFTICMHLALQTRKSKVSTLLCSFFCILDLFTTIDIARSQYSSYVFGVGIFSLGILLVLYIDGRKRPGVKQCMMKDIAGLGYFLVQYYNRKLGTYYPYIISGILSVWTIIDLVRKEKTPLLPGVIEDDQSTDSEEIGRKKRPRRKASLRVFEKEQEAPIKKTASKPQSDKKTKAEPSNIKAKSEPSNIKVKSEPSNIKAKADVPAAKVDTAVSKKKRPVRAAAREARSK
ncbi:hypothetical protein NEAUS06_1052 [Nematocida ausubeli]|nr:hypothetical protein NEAUS06_1052 [Nematocida ausubeli]